jgi:uncharacterized membrane protein
MNSDYLLSMVIGFVLVFAGALVAYKGRKKNNSVVITVGIMIIFFAIAIATITTLQNLK